MSKWYMFYHTSFLKSNRYDNKEAQRERMYNSTEDGKGTHQWTRSFDNIYKIKN